MDLVVVVRERKESRITTRLLAAWASARMEMPLTEMKMTAGGTVFVEGMDSVQL